ncbi:hypothetical protein [Bifidobacterium bombi]|uniref:hypothetical protein n=1 Tax=Bifidobacterium bombi TaxID=471511 RepID=UPI001EE68500|nr:hypothetical protein [Bifidobacterium bombi]
MSSSFRTYVPSALRVGRSADDGSAGAALDCLGLDFGLEFFDFVICLGGPDLALRQDEMERHASKDSIVVGQDGYGHEKGLPTIEER